MQIHLHAAGLIVFRPTRESPAGEEEDELLAFISTCSCLLHEEELWEETHHQRPTGETPPRDQSRRRKTQLASFEGTKRQKTFQEFDSILDTESKSFLPSFFMIYF